MLARILAPILGTLHAVFWSPGSSFSVPSLLCALCVASAVLIARRRRPVRLRALLRALLRVRWLLAPSGRADVRFFLFNTLVFGLCFGWALVSFHAVAAHVTAALAHHLGAMPPAPLPAWLATAIATIVLFLAYELAYWIDHALSHRIPALWEFHKVHHTAETLSPLTVFRVHPLESVKFLNILALFTGATAGAMGYLFGRPMEPLTLSGTNVILVGFVFVFVHLQHTHVWIATTGFWGRLLLSPAHHQIHHSDDPAHFNTNLGSCLALWDWAFGTLILPPATPQRLRFGVAPHAAGAHSLVGTLLAPIPAALRHVLPRPRRRPDPPIERPNATQDVRAPG